MKSIRIGLYPVRDGEEVSGQLTIQRKRGDTWVSESIVTVVSGSPEAERNILLENDQRLVVEGTSNVRMVYDRQQMVSTPRIIPRNVPPPGTGDDPLSPARSAPDRALEGSELADLMRQEERDRMISEARHRLKAAQKPPAEQPTAPPEATKSLLAKLLEQRDGHH